MDALTLRQLRYFEALARHGHFGRAAAAASISQPALSVQIRELEASLGAPLFERGRRHVGLTSFGEEVATRARGILQAVEELESAARAARGGAMTKLRLGVIPTVAPYLLPSLIGALTDAHPGLDLHVRETLTSRLIQDLQDGRIDAAILALPVSEPSLTETAIFSEDFVLIRPVKDEGAPAPGAEALREMRLLLLEEGHCFRDQALAYCGAPAAQPREGLDASSLSTLIQMVASGVGVTLAPEMALSVETRSADVCVTRFPDPAPSRTIGMVWRKTNPMATRLRDVADAVARAAETIAPA